MWYFILYKPIKNIIKEEVGKILCELLEQSPEAPKGAPFGKYLWAGDERRIRKDDIHEPNTEIENEFLSAYEAYTDIDVNGSARRIEYIVKNILKPLKNNNLYSKYLIPENKTVYRGMKVNIEDASKILGIPVEAILESKDVVKTNKGGKINGKNSNIMSWSHSKRVAYNFVADNRRHFSVSIILSSNPVTNGDFYFNINEFSKKFNMTRINSFFDEEDEVISLGTVNFDEAIFMVGPKRPRPIYSEKKERKLTEETLRLFNNIFSIGKTYEDVISEIKNININQIFKDVVFFDEEDNEAHGEVITYTTMSVKRLIRHYADLYKKSNLKFPITNEGRRIIDSNLDFTIRDTIYDGSIKTMRDNLNMVSNSLTSDKAVKNNIKLRSGLKELS